MEKRERAFVLKGNIVYSQDKERLISVPQGYLVCEDGKCAGVFRELPERYQKLPIRDFGNDLLVPGMTDLHVHAPQYAFRGLGMDMELLDWLNQRTFPEEAKYQDLDYAKTAYSIFVEDLKQSVTTRACIFGTLHVEATMLLMELLEASGLKTMVGKVHMDRNAPEYLCEADARTSADALLHLLRETKGRFKNTQPILTPRFIPTCSDELMERLGEIRKIYHLPVQSHLSENQGEIAWVKELCPSAAFYGAAYDKFQMFGGDCRTIMAHCVSSAPEEIALLKERGVYIAHCPQSNVNLASGIAPARKFLDRGMFVGLGTDVAGGASLSMLRAMADAIQVSKLRWRLVDEKLPPVSFFEAFYMATKGGGSFFGKVGSFEEGYEFDAVALDDSAFAHPQELSAAERMERMIYLTEGRVTGKYVSGERVL